MKNTYQTQLLKILQEKQTATIEELAAATYVSPSTIRRCLSEMQTTGLITRTHGGAKINDDNNFFPSFTFRSHQNCFEKKKIALAAMKLIKNGSIIFLDGSTSAFFIAEYLSAFENVKVITNGIDTLSLLAKHNIEAYSTGGRVSPVNRSVLVGHYAQEMIESLYADFTFFSAQSVNTQGEVYDCFEEENVLRKSMLQHSATSVLLCDSTKFNQTAPYRLCSLNDVDYVVSERDVALHIDATRLKNPPQFLAL